MSRAITIFVRTCVCLISLGTLPLLIIVVGGFDEFIEFITAGDL